jgi:hypothetical protein
MPSFIPPRARLAGVPALLLALLAAPCAAQAAEAPVVVPKTAGPQVFTPGDFARFAPRNAADMLQRVPGFVIKEPDDDLQRGLGQATSNVLLNGERIPGKASDITAALARIPAESVVRIEIADAASLNIAGLTGRIASVVAKAQTASGQFSWRPEFRNHVTDPLLTRFDVSLSGVLGPVEYNLGLADSSNHSGAGGGTRIYDAARREVERRQDRWRGVREKPRVNGRFVIDGPGSSVGTLNAAWQGIFYDYREEGVRYGPGLPNRIRTVRTDENDRSFEIGGDYDFDLLGGRLKLIGLRRREHNPYTTDVVTDYADQTPTDGSRYTSSPHVAETILRGEYRLQNRLGDWQLALERADNRLDDAPGLYALDSAEIFQPQPLTGSAGRVEERRYEAVASWGRAISPRLTLRLTLGGEYSELAVAGGSDQARRFWRPKGSLSAAWKPGPGLDLNLKLQRQVGQLDFRDFLASVSLNDGRANAGNPDLVPPQSWELEAEAARSLGAVGATSLRLFVHRIDDIVDTVPIGPTGESAGNIDRAWRYGAEWKGGFNLDRLGWRGARFDARLLLQGSRLKDPLTGKTRQISKIVKHDVELAFRDDLPGSDWAWGGDATYERYSLNTRLTEVGRQWEGPVWLSLYVERKNVHGLTVRAQAGNLLGADSLWDRTVYQARRTGPVNYFEDRDRRIGQIFTFTISGRF